MTDKERAEQFADDISAFELTLSSLSTKDKRHAYRLGRYDGFLAGFKAGKPKWHDLRKDPNDLPDTDRNVWVKRECETECQIDNYYEDDKGWGIMFREGYCTDDVIAWCELPIFEEVSE